MSFYLVLCMKLVNTSLLRIHALISIQFILIKSSVPNGHNYLLFTMLKNKNKNNKPKLCKIWIKTKLKQYTNLSNPRVFIARFTRFISHYSCVSPIGTLSIPLLYAKTARRDFGTVTLGSRIFGHRTGCLFVG